MKRLTLILLVYLAACSRTMSAADGAAEVKRLELGAWEAWRTHDLASWDRLMAPDYVYTDGKDRRERAQVRREFDIARLAHYRTGPMQAFALAPDVVGLSYRADFDGMYQGKPVNEHVAEFSVWTKRNGRWQNVLLQEIPTDQQGTSIMPPTKPASTQD